MAVNKKVMQEGGGGGGGGGRGGGTGGGAPSGRRNLFSLAGRFIERLPPPTRAAPRLK